ncbi:oligosaccharide flippase family protein [Chloroflexota bacterium]
MNIWTKIGKNSFIYGISTILPQFISLFLLPVYTRYLTPSDFGILAMLDAIAIPMTIFLALRLNTAIIRFFFDYTGDERKSYLGTIFLFLMVYALLICSLLIFFGKPLFENIFNSEVLFYPFVVWQIIISFLGLAWVILSSLLIAEQQAGKRMVLSLVSTSLNIGLILYFIIVQGLGVKGYITAVLITNSLMFFVYLGILYKKISLKLSWPKLKESLIFCIPLLPNALISYVLTFTDRWFLLRYYGLVEVGLYSIAIYFMRLIGYSYSAVGQAWTPIFFQGAGENENQAKLLLTRTVTFWAAGGGFITLMLALFSREVLLLMTTAEFHPAYTVVPILTFNGLVMGIRFFPRYGILFIKKTKAILMITSVATGTNVIANFLLVPQYGIFGAAYATLIANLAALAITWLVMQKYYPVRFEYVKLAAILGMVALLSVFVNFAAREILYIDIPLKIGVLVVYSLGILYLRIIDKNQLAKLRKGLNLKTLFRLLRE